MSHTIYPLRCVPKKCYKFIEQDKIPLLKNKYVIRYSEQDVPLFDVNALNENLKKNMASNKFVTGLSVTLLGRSRKEDAKYIIKGNRKTLLSSDWHCGDDVIRVRSVDFDYKPQRGFYGLLVDKILSCFIDLPIMKDDVEIRKDKVRYELVHKPTQCNFWHFCIFPYGINSETGEKYYLRDDKPSKKRAETATRNIALVLKQYATLACDVQERPLKASIYR